MLYVTVVEKSKRCGIDQLALLCLLEGESSCQWCLYLTFLTTIIIIILCPVESENLWLIDDGFHQFTYILRLVDDEFHQFTYIPRLVDDEFHPFTYIPRLVDDA